MPPRLGPYLHHTRNNAESGEAELIKDLSSGHRSETKRSVLVLGDCKFY